MTSKEVNKKFEEAYEKACSTALKFPPDIMLQFYAYYKRGTETEGFYTPSGDSDLRSAFKINALLQVKHLSKKEAKLKYIEMVKNHIGKI